MTTHVPEPLLLLAIGLNLGCAIYDLATLQTDAFTIVALLIAFACVMACRTETMLP